MESKNEESGIMQNSANSLSIVETSQHPTNAENISKNRISEECDFNAAKPAKRTETIVPEGQTTHDTLESIPCTTQDLLRDANRRAQFMFEKAKIRLNTYSKMIEEKNAISFLDIEDAYVSWRIQEDHLLKNCKNRFLTSDECENRKKAIDYVMEFISKLKESKLYVTRAALQLCISIFDRYIPYFVENSATPFSDFRYALLCVLSLTVTFECAHGSHHKGNAIQKRILLELGCEPSKPLPRKFLFIQNSILEAVDYSINHPLAVDFATYYLLKLEYDISVIDEDAQLVAFLLDLFSLSENHIITPPSLSAAAAVMLMRRIMIQGTPINQLWNSMMVEVTGYPLREIRPCMVIMNDMLLKNVDQYKGLKALHRNGWSDVSWEL